MSISDKEHLIEFNKHIKSTYPIKIEREKYVKLKISNKHIGNSLINKGCIPKKSLILEFPNLSQVPKFLIRHFIRGYFDGDGCICNQLNNKGCRFIPPTESEVRDYCNERRNNVNAEAFFAYYESNGWMVGKNKMKDWKAAVRTWEQKSRVVVRPKPMAQPRESNRQRLDRIAQELLGGFSYDGNCEEQ